MTEGFIGRAQESGLRDNRTLIQLCGMRPQAFCPSCKAKIHFLKTVNGKQMPCEMDIRRGDGRMTLVTHEGETHRKAGPDIFGYEPHFAFCPAARQSRKGGAK